MSRSTYVRLALVAVLLTAACGSAQGVGTPGSSRAQVSSSTPVDPRWPCLARFGARETRTADGLPIAVLGRGAVAVVLSNESDEDACGWAPYVAALRQAHRMLVLYDYVSDPVENLVSLVHSLHARSIVLVGASEGAKASIVAARRSWPAAVISLSAEATLAGEAVAPYAARLRAPALFVTAADDSYDSTSAARTFFRADRAPGARLVVVPGDAHGTALLGVPAARRAVLAFLAEHAAKRGTSHPR